MALKDLLAAKITVNVVDSETFAVLTGITKSDAEIVAEIHHSLTAGATPFGWDGSYSNILAALYQDDDAHDTCTLVACLNPLHPGPCKGWKHTLHQTSPGAWHALEAARVEKANHNRIKKIEALKAQGKPIPHKLLQPIIAKTHPGAGKTANAATGEAHAAGKAISDAAGVHVKEPGKVTLGQAVKPVGPVEKGPKGKKPTLASKGIAFIIGQEKVTPQYKLDKAAGITPEQWNALSSADKASIRDELAKIQKDGFGPQQKKATELIGKFGEHDLKAKIDKAQSQTPAKLGELKPGLKEAIAKQTARAAEDTIKGRAHMDGQAAKEAPKLSEIATPKTAVTTSAPKPLPKHVQHAIDMANGHAPGASWSKNHLAAYQPLTADEFHGLPPATQDKITSELGKAIDKFLDPKKVQASKDLLAKFGKGPSTPNVDKKPKPVASEKTVGFASHLHDHNVTQAQAKEAAANASPAAHFLAAKQTAGLSSLDNPDSPHHSTDASYQADHMVDMQTQSYGDHPKILAEPQVHAAVEHLAKTTHDFKMAQSVGTAKQNAYNKISLALANDNGQLSPIEKASLQHYQKYLLNHPVAGGPDAVAKLQVDVVTAINDLHDKLHAAVKKANAPKPEDMSPAQITDRAKELLGAHAAEPKVALSLSEVQHTDKMGKAAAAHAAAAYSPAVISDPTVAAKYGAYAATAAQFNATNALQGKLDYHLKALHQEALVEGLDQHGNPLTPDDKKIIELHAEQLKAAHAYIDVAAADKKVTDAKAAFLAAADKAKAHVTPAESVKLSDYDKVQIGQAYTDAWYKHAAKAVSYGSNYQNIPKMKANPEYAPLTQDLGDLKVLAGKLALAHAEEHTASLNVPTSPDTGDMEHGPEWDAWKAKGAERQALEKQFNDLHKQAQTRLDTVRTEAGLKKRALPKLDSPAVKATAAESGYYKSSNYGAPNYGKSTAAKNYMLAKAGPKIGVVHQTPGEKKLGKLISKTFSKNPAVQVSSPSKIENVEPVKIGGDASISHLPDPLKKQITADFKAMPSGKYLADPTEDIFGNLVNLAAAHGKGIPDGLSVDQVLKTIDETHSKNLGVANSGMLHKKVTDWLGTAAGKTYAEQHSTPDLKVVKQINGEIDLPEGVTLAPGEKVQKLAGPGPHDASLPSSAFHAATAAEAQKAQDDYMSASGVKWSPTQKAALKSYTGSAYHEYNGYLRGNGSGSQQIKQKVIDIQSAMLPLSKHTLLKRGTGWPPELSAFQADPQKLLGKTFEEPGFTSTTVAGMGGHFSGQPLQLMIEAPAGTPAAFVNSISHFKDQENEMLLAAGTKFKVLSVEKTTAGHTLIRVRVVGDK